MSAATSSTFMGESGYLATITSAGEQAFIDSLTGVPDFGVWLGANDVDVEDEWRWVSGPEAGDLLTYTSWALNQPDNFENEDYAFMYFQGTGQWNDVLAGATTTYVVEYSSPTPIPLPAGFPLLIGGLAILGVIKKSRSRAIQ